MECQRHGPRFNIDAFFVSIMIFILKTGLSNYTCSNIGNQYQSSALLALCMKRRLIDSPHKGPVTFKRKGSHGATGCNSSRGSPQVQPVAKKLLTWLHFRFSVLLKTFLRDKVFMHNENNDDEGDGDGGGDDDEKLYFANKCYLFHRKFCPMRRE